MNLKSNTFCCTHPPTFRKEAVFLVLEEGYKVKEVAANLGINSRNMSRWKQEHLSQQKQGFSLSNSEKEELEILRK